MHYSKTIHVITKKGDAALAEVLRQLVLVQEESARAITELEKRVKEMEAK